MLGPPGLPRFDVHALPHLGRGAVCFGDPAEVECGDAGHSAQHVLPAGETLAEGSPLLRPPPPPPAAAVSLLQGVQGLEWSLGETEFILTHNKRCTAEGWCRVACLFSSFVPPEPSWSPPPGGGGASPVPLLFLYGVPMECQAPEPREDSQLVHLSEALNAVAMEIEDAQVEESCQDLVGGGPEARLDRAPVHAQD